MKNTNNNPIKYQDLSKFSVPVNFRGKNVFIVQLWWIVQATIFRLSPQFMYGFRAKLLRLFGAKIGHNVLIRNTAIITYPWKLEIGSNTWVGDDSVIYNLDDVFIGSNVAIAHRVYLCTGLHDTTKLTFDIQAKPIHIKDQTWLANDIFVGPGLTVGFGTVIGARSTVLHDMPDGMICYGYPCVPVKQRTIINDSTASV